MSKRTIRRAAERACKLNEQQQQPVQPMVITAADAAAATDPSLNLGFPGKILDTTNTSNQPAGPSKKQSLQPTAPTLKRQSSTPPQNVTRIIRPPYFLRTLQVNPNYSDSPP